ncbi:MAG: alpha/beta hydrolase, partial [Myxococcales bacterium]|nr:alpha/beta hydrolase [Myxococcales bacterium]
MRLAAVTPRVLSLSLLLAGTTACREQPPATTTPTTTAVDAPAPAPTPESTGSFWVGVLKLPGDQTLDWALEFQPTSEGSSVSKLWIPAQGVGGVTISPARVVDEPAGSFAVSWPDIGAEWLIVTGNEPSCFFSQHGMTFECQVEGVDAEAFAAHTSLPPRSQTPKAPFPYAIEEVRFDNPDAAGVALAGTLTIPDGPGPHPGVVLLSGSGPQDRDEALFGHQPFWVLADHLSRNGIAVLRFDDRGVGQSTGAREQTTMVDYAGDGWAAVRYLAGRPEIARSKIGVIGHSEGGVTGPMIAADHPEDVAFVVMLAGTGVPGAAIIEHQTRLLLEAMGSPAATIDTAVAASANLHRIIRETPAEQLDAALAAELRTQIIASVVPVGQSVDEAVADQLKVVGSPWYRHFVTWDPAPVLRKLKVPVLVLNGELDLQVDPDQNLPAIEAALKKNRRAKVIRFPGLNHLFQPAKTG